MVKIYRISDSGNSKEKLPYADKFNCIKNFIKEFGKDNLFVFADNCNQSTILKLKEIGINPIEIKLGNSGSFMYTINFVISNFSQDTIVYFVEDDYWHLPKSLLHLSEGLQIADYVTLYDHPDKYNYNFQESTVLITESTHWRTINSTTMTFATRVGVLKQDFKVFKNLCLRKGPKDYLIFPILTQNTMIKPLKNNTFQKIISLVLRMFFLRVSFIK